MAEDCPVPQGWRCTRPPHADGPCAAVRWYESAADVEMDFGTHSETYEAAAAWWAQDSIGTPLFLSHGTVGDLRRAVLAVPGVAACAVRNGPPGEFLVEYAVIGDDVEGHISAGVVMAVEAARAAGTTASYLRREPTTEEGLAWLESDIQRSMAAAFGSSRGTPWTDEPIALLKKAAEENAVAAGAEWVAESGQEWIPGLGAARLGERQIRRPEFWKVYSEPMVKARREHAAADAAYLLTGTLSAEEIRQAPPLPRLIGNRHDFRRWCRSLREPFLIANDAVLDGRRGDAARILSEHLPLETALEWLRPAPKSVLRYKVRLSGTIQKVTVSGTVSL